MDTQEHLPEKVPVLLVDDDPGRLRTLVREHRDRYALTTVVTARQALDVLTRRPFAVVVANFLMAEIDGAQLLASVAELRPEATRILLSDPVAFGTLATAVNRARPFSILPRPFTDTDFSRAVDQGIAEHTRALTRRRAEQEAAAGTADALASVLTALSPATAEHDARILSRIRQVLPFLPEVEDSQEIEWAARLSLLGTLAANDPHLSTTPRRQRGGVPIPGDPLPAPDRLLAQIPGLASVGRALRFQRHRYDGALEADAPRREGLPLASRLLHIALDLDALEHQDRHSIERSLALLGHRAGHYDPRLLEAFAEALSVGPKAQKITTVDIASLEEGMILAADVIDERNTIVLGKDQKLTTPLISRLRSYAATSRILEPLRIRTVSLPKSPAR